MLVYADLVDPEDPNSEEAVDQRVLDGPRAKRDLVADLSTARVWWDGPDLVFKMPVRVWVDSAHGAVVGIGPMVFDEAAIELIRTAITVFDTL